MTHYTRLPEELNRGLVAYWKLNDLRNSTSTAVENMNFKDGDINGTITHTTGINGLNPDAMQFAAGSAHNIDCGLLSDFPELPTEGEHLTFSLWAYFDTADVENVILSYGTGTGQVIGFGKVHGGATENALGVHRGQGRLVLSSNNALLINKWYHLAVTFDGRDFTGYINGVKQATVTFESNAQGGNVYIGRRSDITDDSHEGKAQNIRVYNRVLSDGEINKLYRLRL